MLPKAKVRDIENGKVFDAYPADAREMVQMHPKRYAIVSPARRMAGETAQTPSEPTPIEQKSTSPLQLIDGLSEEAVAALEVSGISSIEELSQVSWGQLIAMPEVAALSEADQSPIKSYARGVESRETSRAGATPRGGRRRE